MTPPEVRDLVHQVRNHLSLLHLRADDLDDSLRSLARNAGTAREQISLPTVHLHLSYLHTLLHDGTTLISETRQRLAAEARP